MPNAEMGPLPQADRNAELQQASIKALNAVLRATNDLVLRDERTADYGVDASFEVKLDQRMTNVRSHIQMKATESIDKNADGTVSLQIHSYNLNYLLNGPCPIYVLYDAAKDEMWFTWAHDEQKRLLYASPNWTKQDNVSIRFSRQFTAAVLPEIRDRILAEGRLSRHIHDNLARMSVAEPVTFSVDAKTLEAMTADKAKSVLVANGMTIVASGFPDEALKLFSLLPPASQKEPRLQLISGYAHYMRGRFQMALGCIAETLANQEGLSVQDQCFLARLRSACEQRLGMIDRDTYLAQTEEIEKAATGPNALLIRLENLEQRLLAERDLDARAKLQDEYEGVAKNILGTADVPLWLKLQAKLSLLYVEGGESIATLFREHALSQMRRRLGIGEVPAGLQQARQEWCQWEKAADDAVQEAIGLKHPILVGDALVTRLHVRVLLLNNQRLASAFAKAEFAVPSEISAVVTADANRALAIYRRAGVLDGELRAKMALADFEEIRGDLQAAKKIAADILPASTAMGYRDLVERASNLIRDNTDLMRSEAEIASYDDDVWTSQWPDDQVRDFARNIMTARGIPSERFAVVERDCFAARQIARERTHWCQYLELQQDLRHLGSMATIYARDPNQICVCGKYGYRSKIENPDASTVIGAFKGTYCHACQGRSPKSSCAT
jgi:hypothetical protein